MARSSYLMILILVAITQLPKTSGQYELFRVVFYWGPSLCQIEHCNRHTSEPRFTLHGLWPDNRTNILCNCPGSSYTPLTRQSDINERDAHWFDYKLNSTPNASRPQEQTFWRHEWTTHGTCSEKNFTQAAYFNQALIFTNRYFRRLEEELSKVAFPTRSINVLNAIKKITSNKQPEVRCGSSNNRQLLKEVVICFDPTATNFVDCPGTNVCRSCSTNSTECQSCSNSIEMPMTF